MPTETTIPVNVEAEHEVPSTAGIMDSFQSFFRWKKSIFQLLWKQVLIYYVVYIIVSLIRNFALSGSAVETFDSVSAFCSKYTTLSSLPVAFLLAPYTSQAMSRYFSIVESIPGVNKIISTYTAFLKKEKELPVGVGQQYVDRCSRYVLLVWVLSFRTIHRPLDKLYPDLTKLEKEGLLTKGEMVKLENEDKLNMPVVVWRWMSNFFDDTLQKDYFRGGLSDYRTMLDQIWQSKKTFGNIVKIKSNNIPLILYQASKISLYVFGLSSLFGHMANAENNLVTFAIQAYVPFFHSLPFFLFYAYLKVGQMMADPFGGDVNDINLLDLFEKHVKTAKKLRKEYSTESYPPVEETASWCTE